MDETREVLHAAEVWHHLCASVSVIVMIITGQPPTPVLTPAAVGVMHRSKAKSKKREFCKWLVIFSIHWKKLIYGLGLRFCSPAPYFSGATSAATEEQ